MKQHLSALRAPAVRRRQRGSAMLEYILGAMFIGLVLFAGNPSVLDRLMEMVRANHSARAHAIGSPLVGSSLKP
jgi:hypothetical protein